MWIEERSGDKKMGDGRTNLDDGGREHSWLLLLRVSRV